MRRKEKLIDSVSCTLFNLFFKCGFYCFRVSISAEPEGSLLGDIFAPLLIKVLFDDLIKVFVNNVGGCSSNLENTQLYVVN